MNEGTLAILIQWCLLCLVWMGSVDRQLQELGLSRRRLLAVIGTFLICSFVSWKLYFAPIHVSLSGTLLPLIVSGWLYSRLSVHRRRLYLLAGSGTAILLFWLRWLFFTDPVLLFWDERVIVPAVGIVAIITISRHGLTQLFQMFFSLPLADALYSLYFWKLSGVCALGNEYAQDLLWSSASFWCIVAMTLSMIRRLLDTKKPEPSQSDTRR